MGKVEYVTIELDVDESTEMIVDAVINEGRLREREELLEKYYPIRKWIWWSFITVSFIESALFIYHMVVSH
jgi:hypothetical protein